MNDGAGFLVAIGQAMIDVAIAGVMAKPLQSAAWAGLVAGVTGWCHYALEKQGWRATAWAMLAAAAIAVLIAWPS